MNTTAPTDTELAAENAALKAQLSQRQNGDAEIEAKIAAGLPRELARSAIHHQRAFAARRTAMGGTTQFSKPKP